MSEEKPDKSYGLDPQDEDPVPAATGAPAETPPEQTDKAGDDEPAPDPPAETSHVKALDVCPNCASPLGGVDTIVCLRCGFDMKTLKVIKVKTGETVAPEADEPEQAEPLCVPGVGGVGIPAVMAGVSLLLLTMGYLSGARGLVAVAADDPPGRIRREGCLQPPRSGLASSASTWDDVGAR